MGPNNSNYSNEIKIVRVNNKPIRVVVVGCWNPKEASYLEGQVEVR